MSASGSPDSGRKKPDRLWPLAPLLFCLGALFSWRIVRPDLQLVSNVKLLLIPFAIGSAAGCLGLDTVAKRFAELTTLVAGVFIAAGMSRWFRLEFEGLDPETVVRLGNDAVLAEGELKAFEAIACNVYLLVLISATVLALMLSWFKYENEPVSVTGRWSRLRPWLAVVALLHIVFVLTTIDNMAKFSPSVFIPVVIGLLGTTALFGLGGNRRMRGLADEAAAAGISLAFLVWALLYDLHYSEQRSGITVEGNVLHLGRTLPEWVRSELQEARRLYFSAGIYICIVFLSVMLFVHLGGTRRLRWWQRKAVGPGATGAQHDG